MVQKYSDNDLKKMTRDELSTLIGYDYQDFLNARGTPRDALAIANGHKTLQEIINTEDTTSQAGLSDEQLEKIRKRPSPALSVALNLFGLATFILVFYIIASAIGIPNELVLIFSALIPAVFIYSRKKW